MNKIRGKLKNTNEARFVLLIVLSAALLLLTALCTVLSVGGEGSMRGYRLVYCLTNVIIHSSEYGVLTPSAIVVGAGAVTLAVILGSCANILILVLSVRKKKTPPVLWGCLALIFPSALVAGISVMCTFSKYVLGGVLTSGLSLSVGVFTIIQPFFLIAVLTLSLYDNAKRREQKKMLEARQAAEREFAEELKAKGEKPSA